MATYILREEGCDFDTVEADDLDEAEALARNAIDTSCYDTTAGTVTSVRYEPGKFADEIRGLDEKRRARRV